MKLFSVAEKLQKTLNETKQDISTNKNNFVEKNYAKVKYILTFAKDLDLFLKYCQDNPSYIDTVTGKYMSKKIISQIDIVCSQLNEIKSSILDRYNKQTPL